MLAREITMKTNKGRGVVVRLVGWVRRAKIEAGFGTGPSLGRD